MCYSVPKHAVGRVSVWRVLRVYILVSQDRKSAKTRLMPAIREKNGRQCENSLCDGS